MYQILRRRFLIFGAACTKDSAEEFEFFGAACIKKYADDLKNFRRLTAQHGQKFFAEYTHILAPEGAAITGNTSR